mmetsp:Transcript_123256/g.230408  ORF Transcript_123256/g.230408 Transcript_123256/m.230408 type:complete len:246 (-) Transcript_123256:1581-2318(-)
MSPTSKTSWRLAFCLAPRLKSFLKPSKSAETFSRSSSTSSFRSACASVISCLNFSSRLSSSGANLSLWASTPGNGSEAAFATSAASAALGFSSLLARRRSSAIAPTRSCFRLCTPPSRASILFLTSSPSKPFRIRSVSTAFARVSKSSRVLMPNFCACMSSSITAWIAPLNSSFGTKSCESLASSWEKDPVRSWCSSSVLSCWSFIMLSCSKSLLMSFLGSPISWRALSLLPTLSVSRSSSSMIE